MLTLLLDTFDVLLMQTKTSFNSFHRRKSGWTARRPNFSCVSNFCCMVDTVDNGLLHAFQTNKSLNSPSTNDFYFCYTVIFFSDHAVWEQYPKDIHSIFILKSLLTVSTYYKKRPGVRGQSVLEDVLTQNVLK